MAHNDSWIRRVWCIGNEVTTAIKRKALDAPHSTYALLGDVGYVVDKFNVMKLDSVVHIHESLRKIENV